MEEFHSGSSIELGTKVVRCIVEIEGLLTSVTQGVQQTNERSAQIRAGKSLERCFNLLSNIVFIMNQPLPDILIFSSRNRSISSLLGSSS